MLQVEGSITYNGYEQEDFVVGRTAAYVDQRDNHIAELTVRETLDFAARVQGGGYGQCPKQCVLCGGISVRSTWSTASCCTPSAANQSTQAAIGMHAQQHVSISTSLDLLPDEVQELRRREKEQGITPDPEIDAFMRASLRMGKRHNIRTDYTLRLLGLEVCADTLVGSHMVRGISGGQKKRVTTGELIVGPFQTLFMDEISTGLDASTTFQIMRCLANVSHFREVRLTLQGPLSGIVAMLLQCRVLALPWPSIACLR